MSIAMTKLSPKALSVLEAARTEFGPSASDRRRLHAAILERAAASAVVAAAEPVAAEPGGSERATSPARGGASSFLRRHVLELVGASALVVAGSVAWHHASSDRGATLVNAAASDALRVTSADDAQRAHVAASAATPASDLVPQDGPTFSPDLLPDAPIAAAEARTKANASAAAPRKGFELLPAPGEPGEPREPGEPKAAGDSLGAEMRILRGAHSALKRGELAHARGYLDEHARSYPRGVLREERLALSALVHCSEGHRDEAQRSADELARENPRSSHLERLRGSCVADTSLPPERVKD